MGHGVVKIGTALLKDMLMLPDDMEIVAVAIGESVDPVVSLIVQHPEIGVTLDGEECPEIKLEYSIEHTASANIVRLDDWAVRR